MLSAVIASVSGTGYSYLERCRAHIVEFALTCLRWGNNMELRGVNPGPYNTWPVVLLRHEEQSRWLAFASPKIPEKREIAG